ncbi:MAG: 50S ribosome-binding GTPase [Myxococcales bacterium]|nr:50S ribosome-binding GTPase [Myxococcales bacterium]
MSHAAERAQIAADVEAYLHAHEHKELLRFVAVGSVDDGKSTLIGRLLHDAHAVYEDQLSAVQRASESRGATRGEGSAATLDFSLFTDGLKAEREQGITIDVAYRYFSTSRRKFIIADTPGHVQYTRNMATGASTADVAVILVDARLGVLAQSRRHAFLASLLGIPNLLVCVNKMDLRGFDLEVFAAIRDEMTGFARRLGFASVTAIPISALRGDNVVERSARTPWWEGPTVLGFLETVPLPGTTPDAPLRFPVQYVVRPSLDYRGFAGQIAVGTVRPGDEVLALPSRRRTRVAAIDTLEGPLAEAFAPMSVTLRLEDEIDLSRGDMLVAVESAPVVADRIDAHLVWLSERPLARDRTYLLKHTTRLVRAEVEVVSHVVDPTDLAERPAETLALNEVGRVLVRVHGPLYFDPYAQSRSTGAFVLIDSLEGHTVAAGMIRGSAVGAARSARSQVGQAERVARFGQRGALVVVSDPDREVAERRAFFIERVLFDAGSLTAVVEEGVAAAVARAGLVALTATVGPARVEVDGGTVEIGADDEATGQAVRRRLELPTSA